MMKLFGNRHSAYEELVSAHLDGQLDAAGEATLEKHLATCESCAIDIREQGAVRDLLRAQPLAVVPRSFALPYAPMQATDAEPGFAERAGSLLRGMQIATAAAAVVLVALLGASIIDTGSTDSPQSLASALEGDFASTAPAAATESTLGKSTEPAPEAVLEFAIDEGQESAPSLAMGAEELPPPLAVAPPTDGGLVPSGTLAPVINEALPANSGGGIESLASAAPADDIAPELAEAVAPSEARSAMDWAQLTAAFVTALLAIAVVALTWSSARRPI